MVITKEIINREYRTQLAKCAEIVPLKSWNQTPTGNGLSNKKSAFGFATRGGEVLVNQIFLGTENLEALKFTICHELAHFCVGLDKNHNKLFRRAESAFTKDLDHYKVMEQKEVLTNVITKFKWTVFANLEDGRRVCLGGVHKRTARWAKYPRKPTERDFFHNVLVESYEFIAN